MPEMETIEMMVEEIVSATHQMDDFWRPNADKDIQASGRSAIKQLLAIKAYELMSRQQSLTISLPDFVEACR